jgi:hypothetical protein
MYMIKNFISSCYNLVFILQYFIFFQNKIFINDFKLILLFLLKSIIIQIGKKK